MHLGRRTLLLLAAAVIFLTVRGTSQAQSLIIGQPSATVMPSRTCYTEADGIWGAASFSHGGYITGLARGMCGVPGTNDNLEAGLNLSLTKAGSPTPGELQPNLKYRFLNWDNKNFGLQVSAGGMLFLPVVNGNKKYGGNTFGELYSIARLQTKFSLLGDHSPAFSAGIWDLVGRTSGTGSTLGGIFGVEVPVTSKLTFVTDYSTGNQTHAPFSALTIGGLYNFNAHVTGGLAYIIPNTSRGGPNGPLLLLGYTW
jgi:hypothetical protein